MTNQNHRHNRFQGIAGMSTPSNGREPEVTRYSHPIRASVPCAGEMCWIRGTLTCHTQMLAEILDLLQNQDSSRSEQ